MRGNLALCVAGARWAIYCPTLCLWWAGEWDISCWPQSQSVAVHGNLARMLKDYLESRIG